MPCGECISYALRWYGFNELVCQTELYFYNQVHMALMLYQKWKKNIADCISIQSSPPYSLSTQQKVCHKWKISLFCKDEKKKKNTVFTQYGRNSFDSCLKQLQSPDN